jgi:4-amino-4-deoxy-L-arabinose transferase-like glycosyltransferase
MRRQPDLTALAWARLLKWARRHPLAAILLLAAGLRLGALTALYPSLFAFETTGAVHGSESFDRYAQNLLATGVYGLQPGIPDATLPPLYSAFLALIYAVFGRSGWAVGFVHTLLELVSIWLLYRIGAALFVRLTLRWRAVGLIGALAYACYPYLIFQNLTLIDTPLFILILHAFVYALILLRERLRFDAGGWRLAALAGLLLGAGMLLRPILAPLAALIALWFLARRTPLQTILRLLPVAVIGALTVLPWSLRNTAIFGTFVPIALNGGGNFYQGNNLDVVPYLRAGYDAQWTSPEGAGAVPDAERHTPQRDRALAEAAWAYLRANPSAIPELLWVKFWTHWSIDVFPRRNPQPGERPPADEVRPTERSGQFALEGVSAGDPVTVYDAPLFDWVGRAVHRLYFGVWFGLALIGFALSLRCLRELGALALIQLNMTIVYMVFHPSTRYRAPTDPLLFLFSAYALVWMWEGWRRRRQPISLNTLGATNQTSLPRSG